MYKRPNAPFKAPRMASTSAPSAKNETTLFVPESQSPGNPTTNSQTAVAKPLRTNAYKRPRLSINNSPQSSSQPQASQPHENKRLDPPQAPGSSSESTAKYFTVQWRKRSNKKNKSWDGDGYIAVTGSGIIFKIQQAEHSYKPAGRSKKTDIDGIFSVGIYELEVDGPTSKAELFSDEKVITEEPTPPPKASVQSLITGSGSIVQKVVRKGDVSAPEESPRHDEIELPSTNTPDCKKVRIDPDLASFLRPHQIEGVTFLYGCLMGIRNKQHCGAILADEMGLGKTLMTITVIWTLLRQSPFPNEKGHLKKVLICCPLTLIGNWEKEFGKWLNKNRIGVLSLNGKNQSAARDKADIVNFGKMNVYQVLIMSYEKVLSTRQELATVDIDFLVCDEGHRLKSASAKVLKILNDIKTAKRLVLSGTPIQNDLLEFHTIINFVNPGILGTAQEFQKNYLRPILRSRDPACVDKAVLDEGKRLSTSLIDTTKQFILRRTKSVIEEFLTKKTDVLLFCPPTSLQKRLFDAVLTSSSFSSILDSNPREALAMINVFRKICNSPSLLASDKFFQSLRQTFKNPSADLDPASIFKNTTGSKVNVLIPLLCEIREASERVVIVSNYTQTLDLLEQILQKLNFSSLRLDGTTPQKSRIHLVNTFNKKAEHDAFLLSSKAGGVGLNLIGASRLILFDNDWNPSVDLQAMARIHRDGQEKPVFIYRLFTTGGIDEKIFQRQLMKNNLSDMFLDEDSNSDSNIFDYHDLRNIFTVMDTNCNTHDLIECDCKGNGEDIVFSKVSVDESRALSKEGSESECEGSQSSFSSSPGWMSALKYKALDDTSVVKKEAIRSALSRYRHFDPKCFTKKSDTGDLILNNLLTKPGNGLSFVFTHQA